MERPGSRNFPVCSRGSAECPLWIPPKNGWSQTAPRVTAAPAERKPLNVFPRKIQSVAGKPLIIADATSSQANAAFSGRVTEAQKQRTPPTLNATGSPTPEAQSKTSSPARCSGPPTIGPREPPQSIGLSIVPCRGRWA